MTRQSVVHRTPVSESGMRLGDVHEGQKVIWVNLSERTYTPFTVIKAPFVLTEYDPAYPDAEPYRTLVMTLRDGLGQDLNYFPEMFGLLSYEWDNEWDYNRYLLPARKAHLLPEGLELMQDGLKHSAFHEPDDLYDEYDEEEWLNEPEVGYGLFPWQIDRPAVVASPIIIEADAPEIAQITYEQSPMTLSDAIDSVVRDRFGLGPDPSSL